MPFNPNQNRFKKRYVLPNNPEFDGNILIKLSDLFTLSDTLDVQPNILISDTLNVSTADKQDLTTNNITTSLLII